MYVLYEEIEPYIGREVILTDIDNQKFIGIIYNTESRFDTSSGKEEIEIRVDDMWYGIPFDEIKSIIDFSNRLEDELSEEDI